jgi:hypothetical protein
MNTSSVLWTNIASGVAFNFTNLEESDVRRMRIVYRGLGRAFVVHKNRNLEGNPAN